MKVSHAMMILALLVAPAVATGADANPLGKVIELMDSLAAKITKDGEDEAKAFREYMEWCDDETKSLAFEIKTATTKKEKLEATIEKATAAIEAGSTKIEELAAAIAQAEGELANATLIRNKE